MGLSRLVDMPFASLFLLLPIFVFGSTDALRARLTFYSKVQLSSMGNLQFSTDVTLMPPVNIVPSFHFTVRSKNSSWSRVIKVDCISDRPPSYCKTLSRSKSVLCFVQFCIETFSSLVYPYIRFQDTSDLADWDFTIRIDERYQEVETFLKFLRINESLIQTRMDLHCSFTPLNSVTRPTSPSPYPSSKISLFTIIFLSACVILIVGLSIIWFLSIYYRRYRHYREKKKLRQALARSTEEILRKSPVITYDANDAGLNHNDPTCAICLETFQAEDQLRKLGEFLLTRDMKIVQAVVCAFSLRTRFPRQMHRSVAIHPSTVSALQSKYLSQLDSLDFIEHRHGHGRQYDQSNLSNGTGGKLASVEISSKNFLFHQILMNMLTTDSYERWQWPIVRMTFVSERKIKGKRKDSLVNLLNDWKCLIFPMAPLILSLSHADDSTDDQKRR